VQRRLFWHFCAYGVPNLAKPSRQDSAAAPSVGTTLWKTKKKYEQTNENLEKTKKKSKEKKSTEKKTIFYPRCKAQAESSQRGEQAKKRVPHVYSELTRVCYITLMGLLDNTSHFTSLCVSTLTCYEFE
jgi:hypothetical protein